MFQRDILFRLQKWKSNKTRKPLVLRGARQVGKTTVVGQFAKDFQQYIYLNLEKEEDKAPFLQYDTIEEVITALFFAKKKKLSKRKDTLIFIDEIQEVPEALNMLRYFYEEAPELHVIAAGSLLETIFKQHISFPVGRVEYLLLRPVSFPEFLLATNENEALEELKKIPVAPYAHARLLKLFQQYALIGGMPEIVSHYAAHKDLVALQPIYEDLLQSYVDDVEKYADNNTQTQTLRLAIKSSFSEAGKRIKYHGFGNSNYGSREMGEALRTLEKTLLVQLVFPGTGVKLPILPDLKKSPRLQVLDTGLLNYFAGVQGDILASDNLDTVHEGLIIEHIVGQEILAAQESILDPLHFWVREKKTSMAEVDFLIKHNSQLIPVEVKSGATGKLKSLHLFMDMAPHKMAVRLYSGPFGISEVATLAGTKYYLLNLPYYLASQIEHYLPWFAAHIKNKNR